MLAIVFIDAQYSENKYILMNLLYSLHVLHIKRTLQLRSTGIQREPLYNHRFA